MDGERRTLILSDTHLGRADGLRPEALRPLWRGFERVVFNGDTAELQVPKLRASAERAVWRLRAMADADGVELVFICGNHDTRISDVQHLTLMGGRVLVMHGHALHPGVAPWTNAGAAMAALTHAGLADTPPGLADCMDERLRLARAVASAGFDLERDAHRDRGPRLRDIVRKPGYVLRALRYWRAAPRLAADFAEQYCPDAEVLVLGHSHRQGVWAHRGRVTLNTGCYGFPGRPRAVVAEHATLAVHDVRVSADGCTLADAARHALTLPGQSTKRTRERREQAA